LEEQGWIRKGSVSAEIEDALRAGAVPKQLWYLLVLENWFCRQSRPAPEWAGVTAESR
jgi:hypothetical protein